MKNKIIIANWKMYLSYEDTIKTSHKFLKLKKRIASNKEVVLCPSFIALKEVCDIFKKGAVKIGTQDAFWEERGAYTGEISPSDIRSVGCQYVLLGHSERRKYGNETNETIHNKVKAVLKNNLIPIICIGENWEERRNGQKDHIIMRDVNEVLGGISLKDTDKIIIAYEPVWAISTGVGIYAEPEEVKYAHELIHQVLIDLFDAVTTNKLFRLIYGGSVNSQTVKSYTGMSEVGGVLVGNASQNAEEFITLIENA